MNPAPGSNPSPALFFDTAFAYQKTAAMKAAVKLKLFTRIADGASTVPAIAAACHASERGIRILCDFLTINGFLTKADGAYALTRDSAVFLNEHSPAYLGRSVSFLNNATLIEAFHDLTEVIRQGHTMLDGEGSVEPENPLWVEFARDMAPMMMPMAHMIAGILEAPSAGPWKVLDIAAGHGMFGITLAQQNPAAQIHAVDWAPVLAVAEENAIHAGVVDRIHKLPGSAFDIDFGTNYDIALLTNFLHHFDVPTNEQLLRKVKAALKPGGRAAILEFVPNADRVTPPMAASFALTMLATTGKGDAYTHEELDSMCRNAGFSRTDHHRNPELPGSVVVAYA